MVDENKSIVVSDEVLSPQDIVSKGRVAARELMSIVNQRKDKVLINGKQFLCFQDWQLVARFFNSTVAVEWTKPLLCDGKILGWEAKAIVLDRIGNMLSAAESSCVFEEYKGDKQPWKDKADFQVRSMAQTRACAKALRNVFSWVVVLAGYEATPAEEITEDVVKSKPENKVLSCMQCSKAITARVADFSAQKFGKILCVECQKSI